MNMGAPTVRLPSTAWKPGQSGNPTGKGGGRPKKPRAPDPATIEFIQKRRVLADVEALAREAGLEAITCLREIMNNRDVQATTRVGAAATLLDRGFGRPKINVDVHSVIGFHNLSALSDEQLLQLDFLMRLIEENAAKDVAAKGDGPIIEGHTVETSGDSP